MYLLVKPTILYKKKKILKSLFFIFCDTYINYLLEKFAGNIVNVFIGMDLREYCLYFGKTHVYIYYLYIIYQLHRFLSKPSSTRNCFQNAMFYYCFLVLYTNTRLILSSDPVNHPKQWPAHYLIGFFIIHLQKINKQLKV